MDRFKNLHLSHFFMINFKNSLQTGQTVRTGLVLFLQIVFLMGSLMFSGLMNLTPVYASGTCYDITGQGKAVLQNGVANSGIVHFDLPMAPALSYQACVEKNGNSLQVKGWAWDQNFGWVSFYCDNTGNNRGAACGDGSIPYGVTIDSSGRFSGYAWGDNLGWISFDNGALSQVRVETQDSSCQGLVYGFTPPAGSMEQMQMMGRNGLMPGVIVLAGLILMEWLFHG